MLKTLLFVSIALLGGCSRPVKTGGYRQEVEVSVYECTKEHCYAESGDARTSVMVPTNGCSFGKKYKVTIEEVEP